MLKQRNKNPSSLQARQTLRQTFGGRLCYYLMRVHVIFLLFCRSKQALFFVIFFPYLAIPCKPPKIAPKYAQAPNESKSLYRSGETIEFGCQPGYRVVGNGTRECNEGNWTTIDFYCESKFVRLSNASSVY